MSTLNTTGSSETFVHGFCLFPQKLNLFAVGSNHDFGAVSKGENKKINSDQLSRLWLGLFNLVWKLVDVSGCY